MKTLAFLVTLCVLVGCTTTQEDPKPSKEPHYNFNITATDNARFKAIITWRCEGVEYTVDRVDTWGYGSSFEITGDERFTITVKSEATNLKLWIFPNAEDNLPSKEIYVKPEVTYTFDRDLNY